MSLDVPVLIFAVATGLLATSLFGLAPAWRLNRIAVQGGLRGDGRATATAGSRRMNGALVALQFALSLVLLVGTGLLLRSFQRLLAVNPGFAPLASIRSLRSVRNRRGVGILTMVASARVGVPHRVAPGCGEAIRSGLR